jgi:hypothetical protein
MRELTDRELDGVCGGGQRWRRNDSADVSIDLSHSSFHVNANNNTVYNGGEINILTFEDIG